MYKVELRHFKTILLILHDHHMIHVHARDSEVSSKGMSDYILSNKVRIHNLQYSHQRAARGVRVAFFSASGKNVDLCVIQPESRRGLCIFYSTIRAVNQCTISLYVTLTDVGSWKRVESLACLLLINFLNVKCPQADLYTKWYLTRYLIEEAKCKRFAVTTHTLLWLPLTLLKATSS